MIRNLAAGVQSFTSNVFLVTGDRTVLIDPGNEFDVVSALRAATDDLDAVVLTHTHPDHVGNVAAVVEAFGVEVWGYDPDHELVDHAIADGETVRLGDDDYRAIHTPGHKDDHLCFVREDGAVGIVGDLVFANGGFGRTDLAEGNRELLIDSIENLLDATDDDLRELHAGHGPSVDENPRTHIEYALRGARMG